MIEQMCCLDLPTVNSIRSKNSKNIQPDNRLPSHICLPCEERLNSSYDFKVICEHSDYILQKRIHNASYSVKLKHSDEMETDSVSNSSLENFEFRKVSVDKPDSSNIQNITHSKNNTVKVENDDSLNVCNRLDDDLISSEDVFDSQDDLIKTSSDNDQILCDSKATSPKMTVKNVESQSNRHELENKKPISIRDRSVRKSSIAKKMKLKIKNYQINNVDTDSKPCVYSNSSINEIKPKLTQKKSKLKGPTREQCSTCGKIVSTKFRLKMHLRTHTGEKPFSCRYCEKTFGTAQNLKVHERVHTGEKPLLCGTCGKAFAQSAGLVAHMRLHTGEMPYKCMLCPASFRTPGHLQYHIKQHTGEKNHECLHCKKAFISRGDLTQHVKIHTGERPYVCTVCGFRMARSGHLHRHMKIHTGEKPHKCHTCDNSFVQKGDLVRHMKKHLKNNTCKIESVPKLLS